MKRLLKTLLLVAGLLLLSGLAPHGEAAQSTERLRIEGQLLQGTADGASLPEGLTVELVISREDTIVERFETTTSGPEHRFTFDNIPRLDDEHIYTVVCQYAGLPQISEPAPATDLEPFIELPLYETAPLAAISPDQLRIIEGNLVFDFTGDNQVGLRALLDVNILNISNRIIYDGQTSLQFELPVGAYSVASDVTAEQTQRYQVAEGAIPVVADTLPVVPGQPHHVQLSYFMPYEAGAVIHQVFPLEVVNFSIWVPAGSLRVTSDLFTQSDDQTGASGQRYHTYQQSETLAVDESGAANLIFTLEGIPAQPAGQRDAAASDGDGPGLSWLLIGLAGGIVLLGLGVWLWGRRRVATPFPNQE